MSLRLLQILGNSPNPHVTGNNALLIYYFRVIYLSKNGFYLRICIYFIT